MRTIFLGQFFPQYGLTNPWGAVAPGGVQVTSPYWSTEAVSAPTAGGGTFDCTNGSDIKLGVDAATAAALKKQGYRCMPSQRPSGGFGGLMPVAEAAMPAVPQFGEGFVMSGPCVPLVSGIGIRALR
jgi:hypothetical protein